MNWTDEWSETDLADENIRLTVRLGKATIEAQELRKDLEDSKGRVQRCLEIMDNYRVMLHKRLPEIDETIKTRVEEETTKRKTVEGELQYALNVIKIWKQAYADDVVKKSNNRLSTEDAVGVVNDALRRGARLRVAGYSPYLAVPDFNTSPNMFQALIEVTEGKIG